MVRPFLVLCAAVVTLPLAIAAVIAHELLERRERERDLGRVLPLTLPQLTLLCRVASGERVIGVETTLRALVKRGLLVGDGASPSSITDAGRDRVKAAMGGQAR